MVTNVIFFKMLLSVLATIPSGLDVLPWIVLILTIVKVARKADAIVTRIGLNPAITGDSLGKVFPGALSYMVVRTAASQITKVIGKGAGSGGKGTSPNTPSGGSGGPRVTNPGGGRGGGTGAANYAQQASAWQNYSSRSQQTAPQQETIQNSLDPSNQQQTAAPQSTAVQSGGAQTITQKQTADAAAQGSFLKNRTSFAGARSRKTSVPPGVRRSMTYIKSEASSAVQAGMTGNLGSAGTPAASQNSTHSAETRYRRSDRSTRVVQTGSAGTVAASSIRMSQPYTQKGQGGAAGKGTQTAEHTGNATGQTAQSDSLGSAKKSPLTIQSGTGAPTGHGRQSGALSDPNQTRYTRRPPKAVTEPTAGAPPSVKRQTTVDVETSKPGAAGTAHAQQPLGETRPGRNGTPTGTASSTAAGRHSPIRQESRPTSVSGTPTIKGAGQHFGSAGTAIGGQQSPAMRQTTRKSPSAPALGEAQKQRTTSAPTVIKGGVGKKAASTPSRKQRWKHNDRSG